MHYRQRKKIFDLNHITSRLYFIAFFIIFCGCILIGRLFYLQILAHQAYETLSLKNQLAILPIPPSRGLIVDRNNVVVADNMPVYVLEMIPEKVKNIPKTIDALQKLIPSISTTDIQNFEKLKRQNRRFIPIPLKLKLTEEEVATFAVNQYRFDGVNIKARLMRYYPFKALMTPILGYVSRINIEELKKVNPTNYKGTNFIGKIGIEKFYEGILHGTVGYQEVETDVSGRTVRILKKTPPIAGDKLYLTIDTRLQQKAYDAMGEHRGAVVLIDPNNGDMLAFVSHPSYDPNLFVNGISNKDYHALAFSKERPLYNRAVQGLYPPASTVKPILSLIGLHEGFVTPDYTIFDPGIFHLPGVKRGYRDWKHVGHGIVNVKRAITVSCDTYFYQLGHRMGINRIEKTLKSFGFGEKTGLDIDDEAKGVVPGIAWKSRVKHTPWYPGDTIISSIGQGFTLVTPLQLANAVSFISHRGVHYQPHFLLKQKTKDKTYRYFNPILTKAPIPLDAEAWDVVFDGMRQVIESLEGTGHIKFGLSKRYNVAAKTGTAQVYSGGRYEKMPIDKVPEQFRDNSLFIAFAPVDNPKVAIAVIIENDVVAAHVARDVIDAYFDYYPLQQEDHP
jgi:penicillin-binding protein 2